MDLGYVSLWLLAVFSVVVEMYSIWKINRRLSIEHEWLESRGTVGEQFGDWLLGTDSGVEGEPTRLEAIADLVGSRMYKAMRFSEMQELSVDSRIQNRYDEHVEQALKRKMPIGYKILMRVAEELGFDLNEIIEKDELAPFVASLQKYNIPLMFGNSVGGSKISYGWEPKK